MNTEIIKKQFDKAGFRLKLLANMPEKRRLFDPDPGVISLDVRNDKEGEYFEIAVSPGSGELSVLDCKPRLRHLELMFETKGDSTRYLCGHDERHLFVCAIPENKPINSVDKAKDALKPEEVLMKEITEGVKSKDRNKRRNKDFICQGEWFFIPVEDKVVESNRVFLNEPIVRGRGKAHWCEELCRVGGETVMVHYKIAPNGFSIAEYEEWKNTHTASKSYNDGFWRTMTRNAIVYAKGRIRHPDHATIVLDGWYRVMPKTENRAKGFKNPVFID